jgi:hypothetical protein
MPRSALALGAILVLSTSLRAQSARVEVEGPVGNPIRAAAGVFTVRAIDFGPADLPLELRLEVATSPTFEVGRLVDTTVAGPVATIVIPRLLPADSLLYWRATALTARAGAFPSAITGPRTVAPHLALIAPNNAAGQSLSTRRPTFTWRSSTMPASLPPWDFELRVESSTLGNPVIIARTNDTTFTAIESLETNTSYRWRVIARFPASGEQLQVQSAGSFVVRSDDAPLATLLYQNFPNPFPTATVDRTCIWFDLERTGRVELDILDLRGQPVKRVLPSATIPQPMIAGRYGRPPAGAAGGCDPDFTWDGRAEDGRTVPAGIYLVRFRADGKQELRRIVFHGR